MTSSVKFDNQLPLLADKIDNEVADRSLPSKFAVLQLPVTQSLPQQLLSFGHRLSQMFGQILLHNSSLNTLLDFVQTSLTYGARNDAFHPHPNLPPSRGKEPLSLSKLCTDRLPRGGPGETVGGEEFGDLDGVGGRPFPQIVAHAPEAEAVRMRHVAADPADENFVPPGAVRGHGVAALRRIVD